MFGGGDLPSVMLAGAVLSQPTVRDGSASATSPRSSRSRPTARLSDQRFVLTTTTADLPFGPACAVHDGVGFIGVAPDAWMVSAADPEALEEASGRAGSRFDWSDSRALLRLRGPKVRDVLARGLPIDLHPRVFSTGCAAVTRIGHVGVTFWQNDPSPHSLVAVPRSHAGDLLRWLLRA